MKFFALLNELAFQFELKDTDSLVNSHIELMLVPDAHSILDRKMCTRIISVRLCRKLRERKKIDTVAFLQYIQIAVTSAEANDICNTCPLSDRSPHPLDIMISPLNIKAVIIHQTIHNIVRAVPPVVDVAKDMKVIHNKPANEFCYCLDKAVGPADPDDRAYD